jgi:hypothetical protein
MVEKMHSARRRRNAGDPLAEAGPYYWGLGRPADRGITSPPYRRSGPDAMTGRQNATRWPRLLAAVLVVGLVSGFLVVRGKVQKLAAC